MANQTPSTPVKVPAAAANYTPATLDGELRSQINTLLIRDGHVSKIQDQLLHSLHSHPTNWPTLIQNHALDLLRSGEVTTFPALLRRVMDDVRHDNAAAAGGAKATNGTSEVNGSSGSAGKKAANGGRASTTDDGDGDDGGDASAGADGEHTGQIQRRGRGQAGAAPSLALPPSVVEDALRVTRESLEMVCEIEDTGAA